MLSRAEDHGNSCEQQCGGMRKARSTERITSSMAGFILLELASTALLCRFYLPAVVIGEEPDGVE
jgi:hypothetical protein